jgi:F-box protein 11
VTLSVGDGGDHATLAAAIHAAADGERILVRPGTHDIGDLRIGRPLELAGDGPRDQIILRGALLLTGPCTLSDVTLAGSRGHGLAVRNGAPTVSRVLIRDAAQVGLFLANGARGRFHAVDVSASGGSNVEIRDVGTDPELCHLRAHDGKRGGIYIHSQARARLTDCEVWANTLANLFIQSAADPTLRRCHLHDGREGGLMALDGGRGTLEACELWSNALSGVELREGAETRLVGCTIRDGRGSGLFVHSGARGEVVDTVIVANSRSGALIQSGAEPLLRRCRIERNRDSGVIFERGGGGKLEECAIVGHAKAGIEVRDQSSPVVHGCHIDGAGAAGIEVEEGGRGRFEDCTVLNAGAAGIAVGRRAAPVGKGCAVDAALVALSIAADGTASVDDCRLRGAAIAGVSARGRAVVGLHQCVLRGGKFGLYGDELAGGVVEDCIIVGRDRAFARDGRGEWVERGNAESLVGGADGVGD